MREREEGTRGKGRGTRGKRIGNERKEKREKRGKRKGKEIELSLGLPLGSEQIQSIHIYNS